MKKIIMILGATLFSMCSLKAQTPVGQGNVIIDPYAGIPNWANSILYNNVEDNSTNNFKLNGGLLSYGGRVEYMVADNMGLGLDVNYETSGFNYDYNDSIYNVNTNQYDVTKYNVDYKAKKLRAMLRLNYHFVQNDRVDVYAGFAGGYKNVNRTIDTNDPNYDDSDLNGALIPVALRIAIGTRVYFTNNIGAMVELGAFGGGLVQFGLSAKF
jgi:hypothetical protein